MLGCRSGFQRLVINAPKAIGAHCMNHRQVLATKALPQESQDIMKSVVSVVNFVKTSASNSRLFSIELFIEFDASNNVLLLHTDVRWLNRSKASTRVFHLRDELKTFFNKKSKPQFEALFGDKNQLHKIAYLVDIFAILDELNFSLQ